ncbi:hypothetical protein FBU30_011035, partial [Linnemannia zychae]
MFTPRKNRNIRKKLDIEDEDDTPMLDSGNSTPIPDSGAAEPVTKIKKVKKKVTNTVLSFGDDEQESEETFKVKKSSASRRLASNKGKETSNSSEQLEQHSSITSRATVGHSVSYSKEALDELRKTTQSTTANRLHDSRGATVEEKFPSLLGGPTIIPDAATIHLAKKKREQMRLRNDLDEEEFISLAGGDDDRMTEERNTRLVREEDDDLDDGEADLEKVLGDKLALGQRAQRQAEKNRRAARKEMIEDIDTEEEDEEETREWEMQQIRNAGVVNRDSGKKKSAGPVHRTIAIPNVTQVPNIADVKKRLQDRLNGLKYQLGQHQTQLMHAHTELAEINIRTVESGEAMTKASARYTFFQELRSYCRNLAAFFEEKYPDLEAIENDFRTILSERTKLVLERRRLDLQDDLSEFASVVDDGILSKTIQSTTQEIDEFGRSVGVDPLMAQKRRKADRERRKAQRKRSQAVDSKEAENETYDGLSTDDELGGGDSRELSDVVMELEERRLTLFKEVAPEFSSLEAVKRHFQAWKVQYPSDYNKAYGGLLLPLVFDLFVRQETCLWNPIRVQQDLTEQKWHQAVTTYPITHPSQDYDQSDSDSDHHDDEEDMDKDLMNKIVAKSLCPKLTQLLTAGGIDLYSAKQTKCLAAILEELLDYVEKSNSKMEQLLKALQQVIFNSTETHRLQFIQAQPLTPRPILTAQGVEARERYLWRTIGLFRNLMSLRKFVPANSIDRSVVDGLLHDCILKLLEGNGKDTVAKYQMIFRALPKDIRSQERHTIIERMAQS